MTHRRHLIGWAGIAAAALLLLITILLWQSHETAQRFAVYVPPKPIEGRVVFQQKGCGACHGDTGMGGAAAPGLRARASISNLPQLVSAMWNHAPRMWEAMDRQKLPYPDFTYQETARLLSYLYMSGYADSGGDAENGRKLFVEKRCVHCHSGKDRDGAIAPAVPKLGDAVTPLAWTQSMWNHASTMQSRLERARIDWPTFQATEMNDLFAYVRAASGHPEQDFPLPAANPDRGWSVFQEKRCVRCHSLHASDPNVAPALGSESELPRTFSEFGAAMLNHFPRMRAEMATDRTALPVFRDTEMVDLVAFLYSLHYLEPSGSPQMGESIFGWRGCSTCHGDRAQGTRNAPALRGRGITFTSTRLATHLWRHGTAMYRQSEQMGRPWPELKESDIGDLLAFLNSPIDEP